jgi:predicted lipoprotein with Yx(FWY)xxD motif
MEVAIMINIRRSFLIGTGILIMLLIAACGNGTSSGSRYGGGNAGSTPSTSGSGSANVIKTKSATINGKATTILINTQGMTLYYRTSDTATSVCSGGCAQAWPPVLFSGSGSPGSSDSLSGSLTVSANANGQQVEYNGHPLYTYTGDTAPGQMNGEGFGGVWFVAPTTLAPSNGPNGTPSGGGYGGYSNP